MTDRPEPERPASAIHLPALDGLRLVCCTWVVVGHAFVGHSLEGFMSRLTGAGVEVFFALSGFLITRVLLAERERSGRVDLFSSTCAVRSESGRCTT